MNVINNAQDAVMASPNVRKIRVKTEASDGRLWIRIEDNEIASTVDPLFVPDTAPNYLDSSSSLTAMPDGRVLISNHAGLPKWPVFVAGRAPVMIFDSKCEVKFDPDGEARRAVLG